MNAFSKVQSCKNISYISEEKTALETTLPQKLRIRHLKIEAPNFEEIKNSKRQQYIKSLPVSSKKLSSKILVLKKLRSQELVLKVPKRSLPVIHKCSLPESC